MMNMPYEFISSRGPKTNRHLMFEDLWQDLRFGSGAARVDPMTALRYE
jgi:hypothetical protein